MSRTIHDLSVWNKPMIDTCQYFLTSRANQVLRSPANAGFQNRGVCLQVFPSFSSLSPRLSFYGSCLSSVFLCSETKRKCLLRRLSATKFDDFKHIVSKREFFMYSCVLWCEFIDLVVFVWLLLCDPCHSPTIIRSKGCTEKQPAVQTLSTRRRFVTQKPIESQIFLTRGKLLSSLHRSKLLKGK